VTPCREKMRTEEEWGGAEEKRRGNLYEMIIKLIYY